MPSRRSTKFTGLRALFAGRLLLETMTLSMLVSRQCYKILRAIIEAVAVDMMHHLGGFQRSPIGLFPNQTMFENIAARVSGRMFRRVNQPITAPLVSATFPLVASESFPRRSMIGQVQTRTCCTRNGGFMQ